MQPCRLSQQTRNTDKTYQCRGFGGGKVTGSAAVPQGSVRDEVGRQVGWVTPVESMSVGEPES